MKEVFVIALLGGLGWLAWRHFSGDSQHVATQAPAVATPAAPSSAPITTAPYNPAGPVYPYNPAYPLQPLGSGYPGFQPPYQPPYYPQAPYTPPYSPYQPPYTPGYPPTGYPQTPHPNLIGLSVAAARQALSAIGMTLRIGSQNGRPLPTTSDFRPDRVTVAVQGGMITSILQWGA